MLPGMQEGENVHPESNTDSVFELFMTKQKNRQYEKVVSIDIGQVRTKQKNSVNFENLIPNKMKIAYEKIKDRGCNLGTKQNLS